MPLCYHVVLIYHIHQPTAMSSDRRLVTALVFLSSVLYFSHVYLVTAADLETPASEVETTASGQPTDREVDFELENFWNSQTGRANQANGNVDRQMSLPKTSIAKGKSLSAEGNLSTDYSADLPLRSRGATASTANGDATSPWPNQQANGTLTGIGRSKSIAQPEEGSSAPKGSPLPRRSRHLGNPVRPLLTDQYNPPGYGDGEGGDAPDDDVTLPEDDDVLMALLSIAKCRAICPNQVSA